MATVAITGASGFVGSALADGFAAGGWRVRALVRDPARGTPTGAELVSYDLHRPVAEGTFDGVDVVVHAAVDVDDAGANVEGTRRLCEAALAAGVTRLIFISSVSAREDAISGYGRAKLACERLLDPSRDVALRLGLVVGRGGLLGRTLTAMERTHMLPLIDGGHQPVQVVGIDDVTRAVVGLAGSSRSVSGTLTLANPDVLETREVYLTIADALGVRVVPVPVPSSLLLATVRAARRFGLALPITLDNLQGLRTARPVDNRADLERLQMTPAPLRELAEGLRASSERR